MEEVWRFTGKITTLCNPRGITYDIPNIISKIASPSQSVYPGVLPNQTSSKEPSINTYRYVLVASKTLDSSCLGKCEQA
jgi:hypothetical protein